MFIKQTTGTVNVDAVDVVIIFMIKNRREGRADAADKGERTIRIVHFSESAVSVKSVKQETKIASAIMPRGRKRQRTFVPRPWIPNSSSEDDHQEQQEAHHRHVVQGVPVGEAEEHELPLGKEFN